MTYELVKFTNGKIMFPGTVINWLINLSTRILFHTNIIDTFTVCDTDYLREFSGQEISCFHTTGVLLLSWSESQAI